MRYQFVKTQEQQFQTAALCRVLRVSRSGYYLWLTRPESRRSRENRRLLAQIKAIHKKSRRTYGSPRVYQQLQKAGELCGRGRVARLMHSAGIRAKQRRKFVATTDSKHNLPVAENRLERQFTVSVPNTVWAADITYIPTNEGWLYLSAVLDLCSKGIPGWAMAERMDARLVKDALKMAQARKQPAKGLLHHSDRGSQYASAEYQQLLKDHGMQVSMSRKGDCWDNAPMESFFHTLKTELTHHKQYQTREEAKRDIFEYIEVFYNRERLHSSLGYQSPLEFEAQFQTAT